MTTNEHIEEKIFKVGDKVIITDGMNTGMVGTVGAIKQTSHAICFESNKYGGHDCDGICLGSGTYEPAHALDYISEESINRAVKKREHFEEARITQTLKAERQKREEIQKSFPKIWCCDCGNQISFPVSDDYDGNCIAGGTHHEIDKYMFHSLTHPNNPK